MATTTLTARYSRRNLKSLYYTIKITISTFCLVEHANMPLKSPEDVLQFWFGGKFDDGDKMSSMAGVGELSPLWFGVHMTTAGRMKPIDKAHSLKLDESCRPFVETIRAAARGELSGVQWKTERGLYAKMLLCDQLSRNCFRGTKEAFAADKAGLECFRSLAKRSVHESWPLVS